MRPEKPCKLSLFAVAVITVCATDASAQCSDWSRGFRRAGLDGAVNALTLYDDGSGGGPTVFAGGDFVAWDDVTLNHVAKWNGREWSPLGTGTDAAVHAWAVYDDGSGPALYAAGSFTSAGGGSASRIAKWNGATWAPLGSGIGSGLSAVYALRVFDDGSGLALFAGGTFTMAGGWPANGIAKWNGTSWASLGTGLEGGSVRALEPFDDGSGPALYAGGEFTIAGGLGANRIAKWNGTSWSPLGTGTNGSVHALASFDDGAGAQLYASGSFTNAGGSPARLARWNGAAWSVVAGLVGNEVRALRVFDGGSGPALYVGGKIQSAGGNPANSIARWNGSSWSALGSGLIANGSINSVLALLPMSSPVPMLVAGGAFDGNDEVFAPRFATWDGSSWSAAPSATSGIDGSVTCAADAGDSLGSALFVGGTFTAAGSMRCKNVSRWDGEHWSALGAGTNDSVHALAVFDDGSGPALFVGGEFTSAGGASADYVAKWNGSAWSAIDGFDGPVLAFAIADLGSGPALYAAGSFTFASGSFVRRVARWNGAGWSPLGYALSGSAYALCAFDDGSGPALYAGGLFVQADQMPAAFLAKWDGSQWSAVNNGPDQAVRALTVFDDGSGARLIAGGEFAHVGGTSALSIAAWDGTLWTALGSGLNNWVNSVRAYDDGSGPRLYAAGRFTASGATTARGIATWDGSNWSALGNGLRTFSGTSGTGFALAEWREQASGISDLFVGGAFAETGDADANSIGRFGPCRPGTTYCFGDDLDAIVTTDCPCGNFGASGHGCANSNSALGGARLTAIGTTSPNTVAFTCTGMPNNSLATFWRGTQSIAGGQIFHDGIQCAAGTVIRFGQQTVGQGGNPPFTVSSGTVALAPGSTRYYQVHYRNPNAGFCPPGQFNFSNGYRVTW